MTNFTDNFQKYSFPNLGWTRIPKPPITEQNRLEIGLKNDDSNKLFLQKLCYKGFEEKLKSGKIKLEESQKYTDQCKRELDTFEELGFTDYILLIWAVVNKARDLGVFLDFGRGSVSGSLVCWFIRVSGVDPVKNGLFFTRFVSKARAESKVIDGETWLNLALAPDVDLNVGEGRDEIIKWLKEIYPNRICKISNVVTMTGKLCVKEVYKSLEEVNEDEAKRIADLIERISGVVQSLETVNKDNKEFKDWAEKHKETYECCLKLEGCIKNYSSHASGYIVSYDEILNHSPLILDSDKNLTCAYIMDDVQSLKLDLLGLDTNKIIKEVVNLTGVDVESLNLEDDPIIYNQFQGERFMPYGLYQISAPCAYRVCLNLKPKNVLELSHAGAIARPGALSWEKDFQKGQSPVPHEIFRKTLAKTRNICIYQETMMQMAMDIGFTVDEAEILRRIVGKKKVKETKEWKEKIHKKVEENNLPKEVGDLLWKILDESSLYSFNLSHSLSTSYLSALTVYLKYKYPLEFFLVCLDEVKNKANFVDHIGQIKDELMHFNIELKPPSLIHSDLSFKIKDGNIIHGLSSIKGIAAKTIDKLNKFRQPFTNKFQIFSSADEAGINISVLCSLIAVGCLSEFEKGTNRARLIMEAQLWHLLDDKNGKERRYCISVGEKFSYDLLNIVRGTRTVIKDKPTTYVLNDEGKPIIKESRYQTIKKHFDPYYKMYEENVKNVDFLKYWFERKYLGYSYSVNLIDIWKKSAPDLMPIYEAKTEFEDSNCHIVGEVSEEAKSWKSKEKKTDCFKIVLKDASDSIECLAFNNTIEDLRENNGRLPKLGDICVVAGKKKGSSIFMKRCGVQKVEVFEKISQLPKSEIVEEKS